MDHLDLSFASQELSQASTEEEYSLFISNVPSSVNKETLHEVFRDFGKISSIILQDSFLNVMEQVDDNHDEEENLFGFAMITFKKVSNAFDALFELTEDDDFSIMGQKLR